MQKFEYTDEDGVLVQFLPTAKFAKNSKTVTDGQPLWQEVIGGFCTNNLYSLNEIGQLLISSKYKWESIDIPDMPKWNILHYDIYGVPDSDQ